MGCSWILDIEDLPALDPDARPSPADPLPDARTPDARAPDARTPDARPDAREAPDAAVLPPAGDLVDRNLLTRYFIDEADNGTGEAVLEDSAPDPLELAISYAGGNFILDSGNRGLRWNGVTVGGRAAALLESGGKVRQTLDGATRATIEVVVAIDGFVAGSRISHIGEAGDRGVFTLRLENDPVPSVRFVLNNDDTDQNVWNIDLAGRQRTVLHLVLDTTQGNEDDRVLLYVDGEEQPSAGTARPDRDEAIDILSVAPYYVLGNSAPGSEDGGRGILGTIFYAAMYSTALGADEVAHNADILRASDDAP